MVNLFQVIYKALFCNIMTAINELDNRKIDFEELQSLSRRMQISTLAQALHQFYKQGKQKGKKTQNEIGTRNETNPVVN